MRITIGVLGLITMSLFTGAATAVDLDAEIVFHIGPQPLDRALLEFSKQANTPVAFAAKSIGSLRTAGLNGKFVARNALSALLCNSGLSFSQIGGTVTVVPVTPSDEQQHCASVPAVTRIN